MDCLQQIACFFFLCFALGKTEGICLRDSLTFRNGSVWQEDACTVCSCHTPIILCEKVTCPDPRCDITQGELLWQPDGECCPVCRKLTQPCVVNNVTMQAGSEWRGSDCERCECVNGSVQCHVLECTTPHCQTGHVPVTLKGRCCPECISADRSCEWHGLRQASGSLWSPVPCTVCTCTDGSTQCYLPQCPPLHCNKNEDLVELAGQCCPSCVSKPCRENHRTYQLGEVWQRDECTVCVCQQGEPVCIQQQCPHSTIGCPLGEQQVWKPDKCCPLCVKKEEGVCEHGDQLFYSGEMWNVSQCEMCTCHQGAVQCMLLNCEKPHCQQDERLETPDGGCCPLCVTKRPCQYEDGHTYQSGESWHPDLCTLCSCVDGRYDCYNRSCPSCPHNSVRISVPGQCCPICRTVRCPAGCASCLPADPYQCTRCVDTSSYVQQGRCVSECDQRFYISTNRHCTACHTSCAECSGPTQYHCSKCQHNLLMLKGQCVITCPHGYFKSNSTCLKCSESCGSCDGPGNQLCTTCQLPGQQLRDGQCVDHCSERQDLLRSPERQEKLTNLERQDLLKSPERQDKLTNPCQACAPGCMSCSNNATCLSCKEGLYLRLQACVALCGSGFKPDSLSRTCQANVHSPSLDVMYTIQGAAPTFTISSLTRSIKDEDTPLDELEIHLLSEPTNGRLYKVAGGRDTRLGRDSVITTDDLQHDKVTFQYDGKSQLKGSVELWVSDGQLGSPRYTVPILVHSLKHPEVVRESPLVVIEGEQAVIRASEHLDIEDEDTTEAVLIRVHRGGGHGVLIDRFTEEPVVSFRVSDLRHDRLAYVHSGDAASHDHLLLRVTDGNYHSYIMFNIVIKPKDSLEPLMVTNQAAVVEYGGMVQITANHLKAKPQANLDIDDIIYTLTPPRDNPQAGEILMVVPKPQGGATAGWDDLGDGNMGARMFRFLQRDVDEGRIWYTHYGKSSKQDYLKFEISDMAVQPHTLADQEFHINVLQVAPPAQKDLPSSVIPTLAPGVRLGMRVVENTVTPITQSDLSFQDADTSPTELVYEVSQHPGPAEGVLVNMASPTQPVDSFTQSDINQNIIVYRAPLLDADQKEQQYHFKFIVKDIASGYQLPEQTFTFYVVPARGPSITYALQREPLVIQPGEAIGINPTRLVMTEPSSDSYMILTLAPHSGIFFKEDKMHMVELREGDQFTFAEFGQNVFFYRHYGGPGGSTDQMTLTLVEAGVRTHYPLEIGIMQVDDAVTLPRSDTKASFAIFIVEGQSEVVTPAVLWFTSAHTQASELSVTLASEPAHGQLWLNALPQPLTIGDTFNQQMITLDYLSYVAEVEVGSQVVIEEVYFNVTDTAGNMATMQPLIVTIIPLDNQLPIVRVTKPLEVMEGGRVSLSGDDISVMDADTSPSNITLTLNDLPQYGRLALSTSGSGFEAVTSFSLADLMMGRVEYIQTDHQSKEPRYDAFSFHVSDGLHQTDIHAVNISIQDVNDEPPVLITEQVLCQQGQVTVLRNTSILIIDMDTPPEELEVTLQTAPSQGSLIRKDFVTDFPDSKRPLKAGQSFYYQDLLEGLVVYIHRGLETSARDSFVLLVSDGKLSDTKTVQVAIGMISDETPRMSINKGLTIKPGTSTVISSETLQATDLDSDDLTLTYSLTSDPSIGSLFFTPPGHQVELSVTKSTNSFTQDDINKGYVKYVHIEGGSGGMDVVKFSVEDGDGNILLDQRFIISITDDRAPPEVTVNMELSVLEGGRERITTGFLSASDPDSPDISLHYTLITFPTLGHLAFTDNPEQAVSEFGQADLAASRLLYVHTSPQEVFMDSFSFSLTDSTNQVMATFYLRIIPVDDSVPHLVIQELRVQEGSSKLLSQFELSASDADTPDDMIMFMIVEPPQHGHLAFTGEEDSLVDAVSITEFTMADVYDNKVHYIHDGSEVTHDQFLIAVSDGTNPSFLVELNEKQLMTSQPQVFPIKVISVDDGSPVLRRNIGLQYLELHDGRALGYITEHELFADDEDSGAESIEYHIQESPAHGYLENSAAPSPPIKMFTQEDISNGLIRYVLSNTSTAAVSDMFEFSIRDGKPHLVAGNVFHIQWSYVLFERPHFNITETATVIRVPIKRLGNLKQYCIVKCETIAETATSGSKGPEGTRDYVPYSGQVQFEEWQDTKTCVIVIHEDSVFEGPETFYLQLSQPAFTLIGNPAVASITIYDPEDEPEIQFEYSSVSVNESIGVVMVPVIRTGDSSVPVSVTCFTRPLSAEGSTASGLESGSDYQTRANTDVSRIVFSPGVTVVTCNVRIVDDSMYEDSEQFELILTEPSIGAKLASQDTASVSIQGPNDESYVELADMVHLVDENVGSVSIAVVRHGADLSQGASVWCATRMTDPPSALPAVDYIPTSTQLIFQPGQNMQMCSVNILDDISQPHLEGNETFVIFLSSPEGAVLNENHLTLVIINDTDLDVPTLEFEESGFYVDESEGIIHVPILRYGDLDFETSVICYTRQQTAQVMMDFDERPWTDLSRITFLPGEFVKNCSVGIVDDEDLEADETLMLKLSDPITSDICDAKIGLIGTATITITSHNDVPRVQFEKVSYSINEPDSPQDISIVTISITRLGDVSLPTRVRCSTRDGSALAGIDYSARSTIVHFKPGLRYMDFEVEILYSPEVEWHETFSVMLGPHDPPNAMFGDITVATVNILDNQASGSIVLPVPPVVVSLHDYSDMDTGATHQPLAGYPLICITPCDPMYVGYEETGRLCEISGINQSSIQYHWEVALPQHSDGSRLPFQVITDHTPFTDPASQVLDSVYFRPGFQLRCVAQPLGQHGRVGTPLRSQPVVVSSDQSTCNHPAGSGKPQYFNGQSFVSKVKYVEPTDEAHPNTVHISVRVPHQDGMLPLISTHPMHNIRYLLTRPIYRQQHSCSNFVPPVSVEGGGLAYPGFLELPADTRGHFSGKEEPYLFHPGTRSNSAVELYKHLNLKSCTWTFDAWYHMSDLVDYCGGEVISDFERQDVGHSHITVQVPLYVSYIYASTPGSWTALEHRTQLQLSMFYRSMQWRAGLETEGQLGGRIQLLKVATADNGNLVIDFKTQTKFRGEFVLSHPSDPDRESRVIAPVSLPITFHLDSVWGQHTYDSPLQVWKATSNFNLKDYSGEYIIELIPCTVSPTQVYTSQEHTATSCTAQPSHRFEVPITYQQTLRPVPVSYTLDTKLQLTSNKLAFLSPPHLAHTHSFDMDFDGIFTKGQTIYGRVLWSPDQDLDSAYKLQIEKVFLCTGSEGYVPGYDPTGEVYGDGAQYGCMETSPRIKHRIMILDRGNPEVAVRELQGVAFDAHYADEVPALYDMEQMAGVDGFSLSVDPLYKVESGHQWYLQVLYIIGSADKLHRFKRATSRSIFTNTRSKRDTQDSHKWIANTKKQNGTNIELLQLDPQGFVNVRTSDTARQRGNGEMLVTVGVMCSLLIASAVTALLVIRRRKTSRHDRSPDEDSVCVGGDRGHGLHFEPAASTIKVFSSTDTRQNHENTAPLNICGHGKQSGPQHGNHTPGDCQETKIPVVRIQSNRYKSQRHFKWTRPRSGTEV